MSYVVVCRAEDEKAAGLNNKELMALLLVLLPKLGIYDVEFLAVSNKRLVLCVFHVSGSVQGLVHGQSVHLRVGRSQPQCSTMSVHDPHTEQYEPVICTPIWVDPILGLGRRRDVKIAPTGQ